jgi:hypothetical protein
MQNCKKCQKEFTDTSRNHTKIYCSIKCGYQYRDIQSGKGVPTIKVCLNCGTEFETKYRLQIYCTTRCGDKASYKRTGGSDTYKATREFVYADKLMKGCSRCPERRPSCLQYHHLDPANKTAGIGKLCQSARIEVIAEEMKKCIILCANCHFVEENGDGYKFQDRPDV